MFKKRSNICYVLVCCQVMTWIGYFLPFSLDLFWCHREHFDLDPIKHCRKRETTSRKSQCRHHAERCRRANGVWTRVGGGGWQSRNAFKRKRIFLLSSTLFDWVIFGIVPLYYVKSLRKAKHKRSSLIKLSNSIAHLWGCVICGLCNEIET